MRRKFLLHANMFLLLGLLAAACGPGGNAAPTVDHFGRPGTPVYEQLIWDCNTGDALPADYSSDGPIQPDGGCDNWQINRYERPFNAESQDRFFPDLDIMSAELGEDGEWFYFRLTVFDQNDRTEQLDGTYAIEIDLDIDGRGDVLILANDPTEEALEDWSVAGVRFIGDDDNDVGDERPLVPDPPSSGDGFDAVIFDQGAGDDPDLVWVRVDPGKPAHVEIAFKASAILNDPTFKWWAWTDQGVNNPSGADYHDTFDHPEAGDPIEGQPFFPSQEINELDNTCASIWGGQPGDDPDLCVNDPSVAPPTAASATTTPPVTTATPTLPDDRTDTPTPSPTPDDITPTPPVVTPCVDPNAATPDATCTPTPTLTGTPCLPPNSTAGQAPTCTPTSTSTLTQTATPTVCFYYNQAGQFEDCTPTPTMTYTPTDCVAPYPFAVINCTPTYTATPTMTATTCYGVITTTPSVTTTTTTTGTPTSVTAPNNPGQQLQVTCTPTPTATMTPTVCVNGAFVAALVLCTSTPTATPCYVPDNTGTFITCSPTPVPTTCMGLSVAGAQVTCTPSAQSQAMMVFPEQNANCRRSNSNDSQIVDTLFEGVGYVPLGRGPDNMWMLFRGPVTNNRCWAAVFLFDIPFGPLNEVPASELPYILYPTATPTPTRVPSNTQAPTAVPGPQCNDGVDNDGDGNIDYPADKECRSATDNNES
jgi:hypothetical protein